MALFGIGVAAWRPIPAGVWHDDGVYMLVGKALAGGHGLVYDGVVGTPPAVKFPPLYPALLALLWILFGTIGSVTMAATVLNVAFLAAAGALFARALYDSAGFSLRTSVVVAGLGFVSTDLLRTAMVPLSEASFMLLMMGALALWASTSDSEPATKPGGASSHNSLAALALILLAAVLTRSVGVALVAAFGVSLIGRRRFAAGALVALPAGLVTTFWARWSAAKSAEIPEGARDLLGPYSSWLADQTVAAPAAFVRGLPSHAGGGAERAAAIFLPGLAGWPLWLVAVPVGLVAAVGLWHMVRRFPPLGWFTLAYLGMLLLWPYLDRRLVAPIHPALVAAVAMGGSALVTRWRAPVIARVLFGVAAVWVASYSAVTAYRIADGWPTVAYRLRADRLAASVEALSRTVPPTAIVGAPEFWAALHLHGGWTVSPSVRFDPRSVDPDAPMWGTADEQIQMWRTAGIDHLLLEQAGQLHGAALDQLEDACSGTVFVLAQLRPALVVRIDWNSNCGITQSGS